MRTIALETFKIIHKKSPLFLQDLVTIKNNIYNFRYINTADIPRRRTTKYGKNSLRYKAARLWNIHCQVRSEILLQKQIISQKQIRSHKNQIRSQKQIRSHKNQI
jgi:hypothetical protein